MTVWVETDGAWVVVTVTWAAPLIAAFAFGLIVCRTKRVAFLSSTACTFWIAVAGVRSLCGASPKSARRS